MVIVVNCLAIACMCVMIAYLGVLAYEKIKRTQAWLQLVTQRMNETEKIASDVQEMLQRLVWKSKSREVALTGD